MTPELIPNPTDRDGLRRTLARHGVSLFEHVPLDRGPTPTTAELADFVVSLAESGDARLEASIPCLLATLSGEQARAVVTMAARLRPSLDAHFGWLYRLTRALVISRRPILEWTFGASPELPPSDLEPVNLPSPSDHHGEMTLWTASERSRDRNEPDAAGAVVRLFDKWIRLRSDELASDRA